MVGARAGDLVLWLITAIFNFRDRFVRLSLSMSTLTCHRDPKGSSRPPPGAPLAPRRRRVFVAPEIMPEFRFWQTLVWGAMRPLPRLEACMWVRCRCGAAACVLGVLTVGNLGS